MLPDFTWRAVVLLPDEPTPARRSCMAITGFGYQRTDRHHADLVKIAHDAHSPGYGVCQHLLNPVRLRGRESSRQAISRYIFNLRCNTTYYRCRCIAAAGNADIDRATFLITALLPAPAGFGCIILDDE